MDLSDYHEYGDLARYFNNTVLPYTDNKKRLRLGLIQGYDNGVFQYRPNLLDSNNWSNRMFKKGYSKFDFNPNLTGKMVDFEGTAFWIDPVGSRTTAKGISHAHFNILSVLGQPCQLSDMIEHQPKLILKFLYQEQYLGLTEARTIIEAGEANSIALSPDIAVFEDGFSYMGHYVQSIEGLI